MKWVRWWVTLPWALLRRDRPSSRRLLRDWRKDRKSVEEAS